mmetsp:Transcript_29085/g.81398  ORF Transcript_29085/g.81398 Transcript_29085/m.81398 type:complete len:301 (+) Transcript_29085:1433-2335(+)
MCSVRQRPTPLAPNLRAAAASWGVSALALTPSPLKSCSSSRKPSKARSTAAAWRGTRPRTTSPVVPLIEIQSPSFRVRPARATSPAPSLTAISARPQTQGFPHPRATTAAWLVIPPQAVRMPSLACIPPTSSALVSWRTRITCLSCWLHAAAAGAENTIWPTAAPGLAASPVPKTRPSSRYALSSAPLNWGSSSWARSLGVTMSSDAPLSTRPSWTRSKATLTAARPVRFPLRVCSIQSLPSSMVNSMSCMSLKFFSNVAAARPSSSKHSGKAWAKAEMAFGVRTPATTSSPCALTRNSP